MARALMDVLARPESHGVWSDPAQSTPGEKPILGPLLKMLSMMPAARNESKSDICEFWGANRRVFLTVELCHRAAAGG